MFSRNEDGTAITMHAGDTGAFKVHATRKSGTAWDEYDRMLWTVTSPTGEIVMQRFYRLDDQWDAGNGWFLLEFHNNETDTWAPGTYETEWRFDVNPSWDGTAQTGRCTNALTAGVKMIEGDIVRTKIQSTLTIQGVLGDI